MLLSSNNNIIYLIYVISISDEVYIEKIKIFKRKNHKALKNNILNKYFSY